MIKPPTDTVQYIALTKDFDAHAVLHMAHSSQFDPESFLKLDGPAPRHIGR